MAKCDICGEKIEGLFLGKINGTYIKKNGKLKAICNNCQRRLKDKLKDNL